MNRKKQGCALAAAAMLLFAGGCAEISQSAGVAVQGDAVLSDIAGTTTAAGTTTITTTVTTQLTGPEYSEVPLDVPYLYMQEVSLTLQAEDLELPVSFETSNALPGYTGSGYVSGLKGDLNNTMIFGTELPASQHYDISIIACAEEGAEYTLLVNDTEISTGAIEGTGKFICATAFGIYMEAGVNTIAIRQESGDMLVDCIELVNDTALSPNRMVNTTPCNPDAIPETVQLLEFLGQNYGQKIISGQHVSGSGNEEIARIVETTGKFPAIRFADLYSYSQNGGDPENGDVIEDGLEWAEQGGIVGLMWHWYAPMGEAGVFAEDTDFMLTNAVCDADIATASPEEIRDLYESGMISEECVSLIEDIDMVSEALSRLCDAGVPVLWRPLHQAGSELYWWDSAGSEAYVWLWNLMHVRMIEYHELNNLIWVWSGLSTDYLPDDTYYDIASADVYMDEKQAFGSGYEASYALQELAQGKMIALSECSSLPDVTTAFRDGSVWSYFGLWYEPYLTEEDNAFIDSQTLIETYNSEGVLTREDYIAFCEQAESGMITTTAADEAALWQEGGEEYAEG